MTRTFGRASFWGRIVARIIISHSSYLRGNGWDDILLDLDPKRDIAAGERWKAALQKAA
jgi:hypothetical protein